jgi:transcriptional regulator with XRE-family HTH domain
MCATLVTHTPSRGADLPSHPRPTVRRLRVGSELKRLREASGVKMEVAAERIGGDKSKISRQENGRQGISKLELEALLDLYKVDDDRLRTTLTALAREGRRKSWWAPYGDILTHRFQQQLSIEAEAACIFLWQPLLVPGLLQTHAYAEEFIRQTEKWATAEEVESHVTVRMERQEIFKGDNPPQVVCLLDETVLYRRIGGAKVMAEQLRKLIAMNAPPHFSIQIVPSEGWHAGLDGAFSMFSYPDPMDLDVVSVDYLDGKLYLEENEPVDRYKLTFDALRSAALPSRRSIDLISRAARDLSDT